MILDIPKVVKEWSYLVNDGMPDPTNTAHLIKLGQLLIEMKYDPVFVYEYITNLEEAIPDNVLKKKIKNPETGRQILVSTGLGYKGGKTPSQKAGYGAAKQYLDDEGYDEEDIKSAEEKDKEPEDVDKGGEDIEDTFEPVPENLITKKMGNINARLENAPDNPPHLTKEIKQKLSTTIEKTMKGEDLSPEEEKLAQDYLKFVTTEGVPGKSGTARTDIYLALNNKKEWYPAANRTSLFPPVGSRSKTLTPAFKDWVDNLNSRYDVFVGSTSEGAVGKKVLVPNKLSRERKVAKIEKNKDGSIVFNGKPMKKLKQPEPEVLVSAIRKNNPDMSEDEIKDRAIVVTRQIERYNGQIDDLAEAGDFEYVDYGPVQSPEDRRNTAHNILSITEDKFKDLLSKAGVMDKPENKKVFETLQKLKEFKDIDTETNEGAREEYYEHLNQLLVDMANSVDFKDSVADFAEVKVALEKMSQGNPVYAPSSETFKISDILIINPIDTSNLGFDDADKLSESLKYLNVALEYVGGESVKYKGGGGGMSDDKVKQTVYKGKETRKKLNSLLEGYFTLYGDDRDPPKYPPSIEQIDERKDKYEDTRKWAIKSGAMSEEESDLIEDYAERRSEKLYNKFLEKGAGNCMDDAGKQRYKESIKQYLKEMKMMEVINNNDLKYTKFGNSNQKIALKDGKPGKAYSEEIDGIKKPCYMKFKDDPGFNYSKTAKGCVTATPTNRNPSEIHAEKPTLKG